MKMRRINYKQVELDDLEKEIEDFFGHTYNITAGEELSNGTYVSYTVEPTVSFPDKVEEFKEKPNSTQWVLSDLLNTLCKVGRIPKGEYLISV